MPRKWLAGFQHRDHGFKTPRYAWYRENYGDLAWELDAMAPQELRDRVESYVVRYIDAHAWERHKVIEEAQRNTTKMVPAQLAKTNGQA